MAIINYFEERLTNASAESFNAKIKAFRSQLRGVADLKFFMFRLARLYAVSYTHLDVYKRQLHGCPGTDGLPEKAGV